MMNLWTNINERERRMVIVGGLCTLLYLFYQLIYSPLTQATLNKTKQLAEKQETLLWMKQVRQQPLSLKKAQTISHSKLLSIIATQLNTNEFQQFPFQLQQTGSGDIQLLFDSVPYNPFLTWIWRINTDYAITLRQWTVERTDTPGVVKLSLILSAQ